LFWLKAKWSARRPLKEYLWPPTSDIESAYFAAKYGAVVSFYFLLSGALGFANLLWVRMSSEPAISGNLSLSLVATVGGIALSNLLLGYLCLKASRIASVLVFLNFFLGVAFGILMYWDQHVAAPPLFIVGYLINLALLLAAIHGVRGSFAVHRHRRAEKVQLAGSGESGLP